MINTLYNKDPRQSVSSEGQIEVSCSVSRAMHAWSTLRLSCVRVPSIRTQDHGVCFKWLGGTVRAEVLTSVVPVHQPDIQ